MPRVLETLRNIGIVAHIDAGKTTLTERILFLAGMKHRPGDVDRGTTETDFDPEEIERGITIKAAAVTCRWKDTFINIIDTPGHVDFTAEVERSLRVLDGAVVVFSAREGVEAQSETVWRQADKYRVPRIAFINKMDRQGADFEAVLQQMKRRLGARAVPVQIPIGSEDRHAGAVDLVRMKALRFEGDFGERVVEQELSGALQSAAQERREQLLDAVAEHDDDLMHRYLEGEDIPEELLRRALRNATLHHGVVPVFCGSALKYIGVQPVLDGVGYYLPSPLDVPPVEGVHPKKGTLERRKADVKEPFCGLVFKVQADPHGDLSFVRVYSGVLKAGGRVLNAGKDEKELIGRNNLYHIHAKTRSKVEEVEAGDIVGIVGLKHSVTGDTLCDIHRPILLERIEFPETVISMSVEPESSADRKKLADALEALAREDPTFRALVDEETGQTIISGMGELHLEIIRHRLLRDFKLNVRVHKPRVSYRETIKRPVRVDGVCQRMLAGAMQFAKVQLTVEPHPDEPAVRFVSKVPAGTLNPAYVEAVKQTVLNAARSGGITGYPVLYVSFTLTGGEQHDGESSEMAFEAAASEAFNRALESAGTVLLEPIMRLEVVVPDEYLGDVLADLSGRRAHVVATDTRGHLRVVEARVPLSEMFGYATDVRSRTQGRATYTMEPADYGEAPAAVLEAMLV